MNMVTRHSLRIALAQLNPVLGDLAGNAAQIIDAIEQARNAGADLLLSPELGLCGQSAGDLLLHEDFLLACAHALERIARASKGITVVIGHPLQVDGVCFNAASVLQDGKLLGVRHKEVLGTAGALDEPRYFHRSTEPCVFLCKGVRLGLMFGADALDAPALGRTVERGIDALLVLDATPYHFGRRDSWLQSWSRLGPAARLPVLCCNLAGAQDELIFEGASFALDADRQIAFRAPQFEPAFAVVELDRGRWQGEVQPLPAVAEAEIYAALCIGVREFFAKNGFPGALIGFSGGIDSALALAIATDALGAERVRAVMMASPYTAQMSLDDAREMTRRLGVRYDEIPILPAMQAFEHMLQSQFEGLPADTTEENLQSRIRGTTLMALSNKTGDVVLIASNKSEMAVGYSTLYGDMAGALAVLKDVDKGMVYRLAKWRNTVNAVIPSNIITRPPSAELRPEQLDSDSLPPYEMLDAVVTAYAEGKQSVAQIAAAGWPSDEVQRIVAMIRRNEYKRNQAAIGLRVTACSFGREWRYPVGGRYRDSLFVEDVE